MDGPVSEAMHKRYSSHEARAMSEAPGNKERVSDRRPVMRADGAGIKPGPLM